MAHENYSELPDDDGAPGEKVRRNPPHVGSKDGPLIADLTREDIDEAMFG